MEHEWILKLLYAGFTTQQLHRFKNEWGSLQFIQRKYQMLLNQDDKLQLKLDRLSSLKYSDILGELNKKNIIPVFYSDSHYPILLKELFDYPFVLFCRGNLQLLNTENKLAIVGGRERTNYTIEVLKSFMPKLVESNIGIVSGLAKGTDCDAHVTCLLNGGQTIAVLGFGHDHHYPEETSLVRKYIEREGLVISEYPPMFSPQKWQFPERNRIISGLCQGVLVTEARKRSGSLITLDQALEQGRNVYCLPGQITSEYSEGCNMRIDEGAKICLNVSVILEEYEVTK